jgi:hypothetical protein
VRGFIAAGFNAHIGKPVKRDDLLQKLRAWLPAAHDASRPAGEYLRHPFFQKGEFESFRETVGAERIGLWVMRLDDQLKRTFASQQVVECDRQKIARTAHAITSQAALLGFSQLAELCTALEQACASDCIDVSEHFKAVRVAAWQAREIIAAMENSELV